MNLRFVFKSAAGNPDFILITELIFNSPLEAKQQPTHINSTSEQNVETVNYVMLMVFNAPCDSHTAETI